MTKPQLRVVLFAAVMFQIACGVSPEYRNPGQTSSTAVTKNHTYTGGPFKKLLVIGVFKEVPLQHHFETSVAQRLEAQGVTAVESFKIIPPGQQLSRQLIEAQIADTQIDGVLVTRVVGTGMETRQTERTAGPTTEALPYSEQLGGRNLWADSAAVYQPTHAPGYARTRDVLQTDTALYEVDKGDRVWNASRKATFSGDRAASIDQIAEMIIQELSASGMI